MAHVPPRGYLLDTNVISNPGDLGDLHAREWIKRFPGLIRVSVISIAEIHRGLLLLKRKIQATADQRVARREHANLDRKTSWYNRLVDDFADRIEPIDVDVAKQWAAVSVRFPSLKDADKVIAATALAKGYGVATENLGDFRASGVPLVNPFDPGTWDDEVDPLDEL